MEENSILKINSDDNVAVALSPLSAGNSIKLNCQEVTVNDDIPRGHKIAVEDITKGKNVIKYAYSIGKATREIKVGDWVHTHNLETGLKGKQEYSYQPEKSSGMKSGGSISRAGGQGDNTSEDNGKISTFTGYLRKNGKAGIRNEIWVINTVGCINKPVEKMVLSARQKYDNEIQKQNIDGIFNFPHPFGCSQLGGDLKNTQKILAGLVKHPNAAGVLVVGLGCENNQLDEFKEVIGDYNEQRVKFLNLQDVKDGQQKGMRKIGELVEYVNSFLAEEIPVSKLKIGLKCGGSDSFSGITANPLLGRISDKLVTYGGTTILSEVPEMFGAETILMNRAQDKETFQEIVDLINDFKDYFISHGQDIYENPSPGNVEGGITTLEEKSLGNIEKGGNGPVNGVNNYGEVIEGCGLQLLEGPGNDLVSTTALTVAGAQLVLFTTGRGTPFGCPVPTVKVSTNNQLYEQKRNWIDFNAGQLLKGVTMDRLADDFLKYLLQVASSKKRTKNEINDYREIAIFKTGVTL